MIPELDCDLAHLAKTLRRAGHRPQPPLPHGPRGVAVRLVDQRDLYLGSAIVTQFEMDGAEWIHASFAWLDHIPSYEDLTVLKAGVFGDRREAYQVFAPAARHINIHTNALHLWGRADGTRVLPDFAQAGTI
ncbi:DUF7694 domain-containing protein [Nonomuraea angiospora]